ETDSDRHPTRRDGLEPCGGRCHSGQRPSGRNLCAVYVDGRLLSVRANDVFVVPFCRQASRSHCVISRSTGNLHSLVVLVEEGVWSRDYSLTQTLRRLLILTKTCLLL